MVVLDDRDFVATVDQKADLVSHVVGKTDTIYRLFKLVMPAAVSVRKGIGSIRVNLPRKDGPTRGCLAQPTAGRS